MTRAIEPFVAALVEAVNDMRFRKLSYHWPAQSDAVACAALALVLALEADRQKSGSLLSERPKQVRFTAAKDGPHSQQKTTTLPFLCHSK